jgi:hypothetical protein
MKFEVDDHAPLRRRNVRSLSGAPRQVAFGRERAFLRGALSIGPFEVTRSRGGRGSYGNCFWFGWFCGFGLRAGEAPEKVVSGS